MVLVLVHAKGVDAISVVVVAVVDVDGDHV